MSTVAESLKRELAEGLPTFQYMVENSIDAMLMTDAELQVVYSNQACNRLLTRNVTGLPLMSLWFEEDRPLLNDIVEWARVGDFFSAARLNSFRSVVDQYPGLEIVGTLAAYWDREKGRQAAEELLGANPPGTLDVIWAASGEMGLGAMLAVEAAGRQDEVRVFANDVTPESADRMREGRLMAETHHGFAEWGWYGTQFAVMLALGQEVPPAFDIRPRTVYKDNADLLYPSPALEPIDWAGIKAGQKLPDKIVIGWAPTDTSGVFKTATEYFEKAAAEAREHGINVEVITQTPTTPEKLVSQAAIIEDYIERRVDVIVLSTIEVEVVRQAIQKANQVGIPVIVVNQLEFIEGLEVACYIGSDNSVAGAISAYAVVDYLGGPGILGEGEKVAVEPGTDLDLAWWEALYRAVDPRAIEVKGRVAIIEGISGSWRGENRLVRPDGSVVYVDASTFPIRNKAGRFVGLAASFRDAMQRRQATHALRKARDELELRVEERTAELTRANKALQAEIAERKVVEEALKRSEERFRKQFEEALDAILVADAETGILIDCNRAACELVGREKSDLVGKHQRDLHPPEEDEGEFSRTFKQHLKEKEGQVLEAQIITKQGELKEVAIKANLFELRGQEVIQGIFRDITQRKRAEEELQRAKTELERQNARLETLYRTGQMVNSTLDTHAILDKLTDEAMRVTRATHGQVLVVRQEEGCFERRSQRGFSSEEVERAQSAPLPLDQGINARAYLTHQAVRVDDVRAEPGYFPLIPTTRTELVVPIIRDGEVLGNLDLQSPTIEAFSDVDLDYLKALTDQVAVALSNAELYAETRQRLKEQTALREAGAIISSALDLPTVLSHIAEQMAQAVDATSAYISSYDFDAEVISSTVLAEHIRPQACAWEQVPDLGTTYVEDNLESVQTLRAGQPSVSHWDDPNLSEFEKGHMKQYGARTILYVPLQVKGQLIGFAELWESRRRREFTSEEIALCQGIAQQAAIAIENARLFEQSQQEIAERKRAEKTLQVYAAKLERSNRELEQFAYVASHDLQEPLRKVKAFGDRLKAKYDDVLDDQGLDYLERMQNAAVRMQDLINALLTYSRVTTKAQPSVPVDLAQTIQEVLSDLEVGIEKVGGKVIVGDLPTIEADPTQMRQLLQNLISNALKFHRPDEPPVVKIHGQLLNSQGQHLTVSSSGDGRCQITVLDNGIGFDEQHLDRIFQVFQRLHSRNEYEGTGMGLAICRKIVERHGGSITAQSAPGQGATFIVTLPIRHQGEKPNNE